MLCVAVKLLGIAGTTRGLSFYRLSHQAVVSLAILGYSFTSIPGIALSTRVSTSVAIVVN